MPGLTHLGPRRCCSPSQRRQRVVRPAIVDPHARPRSPCPGRSCGPGASVRRPNHPGRARGACTRSTRGVRSGRTPSSSRGRAERPGPPRHPVRGRSCSPGRPPAEASDAGEGSAAVVLPFEAPDLEGQGGADETGHAALDGVLRATERGDRGPGAVTDGGLHVDGQRCGQGGPRCSVHLVSGRFGHVVLRPRAPTPAARVVTLPAHSSRGGPEPGSSRVPHTSGPGDRLPVPERRAGGRERVLPAQGRREDDRQARRPDGRTIRAGAAAERGSLAKVPVMGPTGAHWPATGCTLPGRSGLGALLRDVPAAAAGSGLEGRLSSAGDVDSRTSSTVPGDRRCAWRPPSTT